MDDHLGTLLLKELPNLLNIPEIIFAAAGGRQVFCPSAGEPGQQFPPKKTLSAGY
jgi:hypothetical protein